MIDKENIESENVYNMDESGFAISDVEASQYIINAAIRQKFQAKPGRQEWVMAIECICVDGTSIPPLIMRKSFSTMDSPLAFIIIGGLIVIPRDGQAISMV